MIKLPTRYKMLKTLPGGGMADAFVCKDTHLDREVVVKSLKTGVDPKRLLDELAALSAIRSKHVVQIYDVVRGADGSVVAVVEEYLRGDDLEGHASPKDSGAALVLLYPIASGIADIHAHSRVHRDIKPGNMKRDADGCIKIFDFGLAKIKAANGGTKNLYFTPGFAPPEAFQKNAKGEHVFSEGLDVFAFGATALSLLNSGALPTSLCAVPPVVPETDLFGVLPQKLPTPLSNLLNKCLATDPDKRPSMASIRDALGGYLLFNKHRASLVFQGNESILDARNPGVKFSLNANTGLELRYDGLSFRVKTVTGHVYVNNMPVNPGFELPGACVIVLGEPSLGVGRGMVSVSVSHPEVTL